MEQAAKLGSSLRINSLSDTSVGTIVIEFKFLQITLHQGWLPMLDIAW